MQETEKIWMNGELVDWADAKVHVGAHGLHYGSGVFEGIRCYETDDGPAVFRLTDHMKRLENSARLLHMELPYSVEELRGATLELIGANGLAECYVRPIAFYGYGELGVHPGSNPVDVVIMSWPWGAYLGEEALTQGISAKVSSWKRVGANTIPHVSKATGIYLNSMLAVIEATNGGYAEAIRSDSREHTPLGILTRGVSGIRGRTLIVNFPGNPKAIDQSWPVVAPTLKHAAQTLLVGLGDLRRLRDAPLVGAGPPDNVEPEERDRDHEQGHPVCRLGSPLCPGHRSLSRDHGGDTRPDHADCGVARRCVSGDVSGSRARAPTCGGEAGSHRERSPTPSSVHDLLRGAGVDVDDAGATRDHRYLLPTASG